MGSSENKCWETTINQLLDIFRNSILSILPSIMQAHIPWKNEDAYDDWDMISETLFQTIVVNSILHSQNFDLQLPKYDFHYESYKKFDYIIVENQDFDQNRKVFISFYTKEHPFDYVKVAILDKNENMVGYKFYKYKDCSFKLCHKKANKETLIEKICVEL